MLDHSMEQYSTFRRFRQGYRAWKRGYQARGYDEEEAAALADLRMMETPFCDECGAEMAFDGPAVAWACPQCGWRRKL